MEGNVSLSGPDSLLPYGRRFLFVKEIRPIDSVPPRLVAVHDDRGGGGINADHFRNLQVYPGAFILEGCAQAAVCLYSTRVRRLRRGEVPLLAHSKARFLATVREATGLIHVVELIKASGRNAVFRGTSKKDAVIIMECELGLAVRSGKHLKFT